MHVEMLAAVFPQFPHNLIGHERFVETLVLVREDCDVAARVPVPVMFRIDEAGQASFNDLMRECRGYGAFAVVCDYEGVELFGAFIHVEIQAARWLRIFVNSTDQMIAREESMFLGERSEISRYVRAELSQLILNQASAAVRFARALRDQNWYGSFRAQARGRAEGVDILDEITDHENFHWSTTFGSSFLSSRHVPSSSNVKPGLGM